MKINKKNKKNSKEEKQTNPESFNLSEEKKIINSILKEEIKDSKAERSI